VETFPRGEAIGFLTGGNTANLEEVAERIKAAGTITEIAKADDKK
jgi:hypothetical protein